MIGAVEAEVWVIAGYAAFLALTALGLERLGRHSHRRSGRFRTAGFRYHAGLDVWECPAGRQLVRAEIDYARGVVLYRAPARACNACERKPLCTDSDQGREIAHSPEAWLRSHTARFHRGLSLLLFLLAAVILAGEAVRHNGRADLLVLASVLAPVGVAGARGLGRLIGADPRHP